MGSRKTLPGNHVFFRISLRVFPPLRREGLVPNKPVRTTKTESINTEAASEAPKRCAEKLQPPGQANGSNRGLLAVGIMVENGWRIPKHQREKTIKTICLIKCNIAATATCNFPDGGARTWHK